MDRKRHLAALADLCSVQQLHIAAARAELAGALDRLVAATNATEASRTMVQETEANFERILATPLLDPDAMRRGGFAILSAEAELAEKMEMGRHAELAEATARQEWHGHRLRSRAMDDRRRQLHRKLFQASEDKAAIEVMALSASRRAAP